MHSFYLYDHKMPKVTLNTNNHAYHEAGYIPILNLVSSPEALLYPIDMDRRFEMDVKLLEYIPAITHLKYVYDFGDNWEHYIEVEKVISDYDTYHPVCLEGEGNTPPEDVGGRPGFTEYLKIIADPNHPDHKLMTDWAKRNDRDFDLEHVNRMLRSI